jgi:hypothetical protein
VHCGALYSCGFLGILGVDCDRNWFGVSYFLFLGAFRKKFKSLECAQIRQEIRHQQFHNKWKEDKELEERAGERGGTFTGLFSGGAECESFSFSLASCVMKNSEESSEEKNNKHILRRYMSSYTLFLLDPILPSLLYPMFGLLVLGRI